MGGLIRLPGLNRRVPHLSTLLPRHKALTVVIGDRPWSGPLHLVLDSTGVEVLGKGRWKVEKHGADERRVWRKVHVVIDAESHEARAVDIRITGMGTAGACRASSPSCRKMTESR